MPSQDREKNCRLLVFAKAPIPGRAKTRLIPALGADRAGALQAALIRHTLTTAAQTGIACELWCHPSPNHPLFTACAHEFGLRLHAQTGRNLGERMYHAARAVPLARNSAILIGTDCPSLTAEDLTGTSMILEAGNDAVLGPALDGGYYLLGLNHAAPSLFEDVPWGSDGVLSETRKRMRALGWRWRELPARRDVDRPGDLLFLPPNLALETAACAPS